MAERSSGIRNRTAVGACHLPMYRWRRYVTRWLYWTPIGLLREAALYAAFNVSERPRRSQRVLPLSHPLDPIKVNQPTVSNLLPAP